MTAQVESNTGPVKVNGDGRFDSPGHSALYFVYSFMDCDTSKILACELVKVFCSLFSLQCIYCFIQQMPHVCALLLLNSSP